MPSENPFRIALLVIASVTMAIGVYHRLQAASSGERISHKDEGCIFAIVLRLTGVCMWISTFAYLLYPTSIQWGGGATAFLDKMVRCNCRWAFIAFDVLDPNEPWENLTDTVVTRAKATLVTHGPYHWVRHPFYVTAALLMVSVTLLTANWLIGLSGLVGMALLVVRTPKEEQMLIDRFGQQYRDYMATTGRFFPRISS